MRQAETIKTLEIAATFAAPPARMFDAWTRGDALAQWMRPYQMAVVSAEADLRIGGYFRMALRGREGEGESVIFGEYLEVEPPRRLRFTWESPATFGRPTIVTLAISERGAEASETLIELTHERLHDELSVERHDAGWRDLFAKLADFLGGWGRCPKAWSGWGRRRRLPWGRRPSRFR
ncbi:MAG: SRPBCC family protein [Alphaproteobacteria bacterium]